MEDIKFNVVSDLYPELLFVGETERDIIRFFADNDISFTSQPLTAERKLSFEEIDNHRSSYIQLMEDVEPVLMDELYQITEQQKQLVANAKDKLQAVRTQIHDHVMQIKKGVVDYELGANDVYRIALDGKFLYYAVIDNTLRLAKITNIPESEESNSFDTQEQNGLVFEKLR